MASIGKLEVFEKKTALFVMAAAALLGFVFVVTFGPWVVSRPAPEWWIEGLKGLRLARAGARWEVLQIFGWVAIVASPLILAGLVLAILRLIKNLPVLRLLDQGVWCSAVKKLGIIPWSDIEGAFVATGLSGRRVQMKMKFLCLRLRAICRTIRRASASLTASPGTISNCRTFT